MNPVMRSHLILIFAASVALAPHLWAQPIWLGGCLLALLGLRAWQVFFSRPHLPTWLLISATFVLLFLSFRAHHSLIGRDGGMAVLACLIIAKLFESKNHRDSQIVLMLSYFCTIAFFLISQSPMMALAAVLSFVSITTALLTQKRSHDSAKQSVKMASRLLVEAVPLAILLFLFFPRLPGPLWAMPSERSARSGLSADAMEPGSISQLTLDDSIAFRVQFDGKVPRQQDLYWRGPVYDYFDGRRWLPAANQGQSAPSITALAEPISYTITLEPHQQRWLLALDLPVTLPSESRINSTLQLLSRERVKQRQRYRVSSALRWSTSDDGLVEQALRLPKTGNPRTRALAQTWSALPSEQRIEAALGFLRNNDFAYTLEPPLLNSADSIDEFLFTTKQGFCEHFASSFSYLMRASGIPARIVTGYQGGEFNGAGGYLIIRQADAHAWVEVWLEGRGWQRIDPTAAVSPARIELGLARSVPQGADLPMMLRADYSFLKALRLQMDVFSNGWNQWVIGYDMQRQMQFLQKLGISDYLSSRYLIGLLGGGSALFGLLALYLFWPKRQKMRDPASRLYLRFCRQLSKKGFTRADSEGPLDFSQRVSQELPQHAAQIETITALYLQIRYGNTPNKNIAELRTHIARFRP